MNLFWGSDKTFVSKVNQRLRNAFPIAIKNEILKATEMYESWDNLPVPDSIKIKLDEISNTNNKSKCQDCDDLHQICKDFVSQGLYVRHGHKYIKDKYALQVNLYLYRDEDCYRESFKPLIITNGKKECNSFTFPISFPTKTYSGSRDLHRLNEDGGYIQDIVETI